MSASHRALVQVQEPVTAPQLELWGDAQFSLLTLVAVGLAVTLFAHLFPTTMPATVVHRLKAISAAFLFPAAVLLCLVILFDPASKMILRITGALTLANLGYWLFRSAKLRQWPPGPRGAS